MKKNDSHFDWKKITEDAFAQNAQDHVFSDEYERRKYGMKNGINDNGERKRIVVKNKRSHRHSIAAIASIAAAAVLVPTSVMVFRNGSSIGKAPAAQVETEESATAEATNAAALSAYEHQAMTLTLGYVPENYSTTDGMTYSYASESGEVRPAMNTGLVYYTEDVEKMTQHTVDSFQNGTVIGNYSFDCHIDGKVSTIKCTIIDEGVDKAGTSCCKLAVVNFNDTGYFTQIAFYDPELSDEEMQNILASLTITETEGEAEVISLDGESTDSTVEVRQAMALSFGWVPERFTLNTTNAAGKYTNEDCTRGISPIGCTWYTGDFQDIIDNALKQPNGFRNGYTVVDGILSTNEESSWESFVCIGPNAEDVEYDSCYFNLYYVKFRDSDYIGSFYASNDVTIDEITTICDNLSIEAKEGTQPEWEPYTPEVDTGSGSVNSVAEEYNKFYDNADKFEVGDTFTANCAEGGKIAYTINSFTIQDNFDGITTDGIGGSADYSEYLDENGNIRNEKFLYADEDVEEESLELRARVVVVDLTVRLEDADSWRDVTICPYIFGKQGGNCINRTSTVSAIDGSYTEALDALRDDDLAFSFDCASQHNKNGFGLIPDSSAHVKLAFVVTEDMNELFLGFSSANAVVHLGDIEG